MSGALPADLQAALAKLSHAYSPGELRAASSELTAAYREGKPAAAFASGGHRVAYTLARMPATYAATVACLAEVRRLAGACFSPTTVLDLGAGPGTASWAAAGVFASATSFRAVERDAGMAELGREIARQALAPELQAIDYIIDDLGSDHRPIDTADLVVASYAFNELSGDAHKHAIANAWAATGGALVIVEPGTPAGFRGIMRARTQLIEAGARILAPCPGAVPCPLDREGTWCRFAARLGRTGGHRRTKGAELSHEDEPYSWVAAVRFDATPAAARVVQPVRRQGSRHTLSLCTADGLREETVDRRDKSEWGSGR